MSAKHTLGPWRSSFKTYKTNNIGVYDSNGNLVAGLSVHGAADVEVIERRRADGRLIAAAPDLLEALDSIVKADDAQELTSELIERARAAIAKARGQS